MNFKVVNLQVINRMEHKSVNLINIGDWIAGRYHLTHRSLHLVICSTVLNASDCEDSGENAQGTKQDIKHNTILTTLYSRHLMYLKVQKGKRIWSWNWLIDWLIDCFMAHQHRWSRFVFVYEETLTGRPHETSVQKAASDNENVDAV